MRDLPLTITTVQMYPIYATSTNCFLRKAHLACNLSFIAKSERVLQVTGSMFSSKVVVFQTVLERDIVYNNMPLTGSNIRPIYAAFVMTLGVHIARFLVTTLSCGPFAI